MRKEVEMMTDDERNELNSIKKRKKIKGIECAEATGCTPALISQFFHKKTNLSEIKQDKLRHFIKNYPEYAIFKVQVKSDK